jgi:glycosyltransferase involved in cell wall biosynthesis
MEPAVSIIVPAYDVTAYIKTALDSIFAQTFKNFEVVVVNDGCPDTTNLERVLQPYLDRIRYIRQEHGGVGAARRTAVLAASAPLIAQLDPDDWWEPNYLEVQLALFASAPGVDVIYPNGYYFGDPMLEGKRLMDHTRSRGNVSFCSLLTGEVNVVYSALIRKEVILRAGNFDPELRVSEDFDLWIRILKSGGRIAYHQTPLLHYRRRPESLTSARAATQNSFLQVLDKIVQTVPLDKEEAACVTGTRLAVHMEMELDDGKEAIRQRNWKKARWHLQLYYSHRPSKKLLAVLNLLRWCPWLVSSTLGFRDRLLKTGILKAQRSTGV